MNQARHPHRMHRPGFPARCRRVAPAIAMLAVVASLLAGLQSAAASTPVDLTTSTWATATGPNVEYRLQATDEAAATAFEQRYGPLMERAIHEIGLLLGVKPSGPITVYAYSDAAAYSTTTTAIGRNELDGEPAIADPANRDISLILPLFSSRTDLEAENGLRHAVAHILIWQGSQGKMPWGFDEGIAQYVERPVTERVARIASVVQAVLVKGIPPSWFDMNRRYPQIDPNELAAQAYAAIAFLIDRYELAPLRSFVAALPTAASWPSAMQAAYGRSAEAIEGLANDALPRWAASGWRTNIVAAFDLNPGRKLLAQANYAAAKRALEPSQALYRQLDDPEQQARIDDLMNQCDVGIQAEALMTQAQQALELHSYDRAVSLLKQARDQYAQLPPEQTPSSLLDSYDALAADGIAAAGQLDQAVQLSRSWLDYRDAQHAAVAASNTYARLGDADNKERADQIIADLNSRQRRIVLLIGALAVLTLAWLALWLWARGPAEIDWR